MKHCHPTHDQVSTDLKWDDLLYKMFFPALILGTVLLVSGGCWVYLGFYGWVSLLLGLVSGVGVILFMFTLVIRELEKADDAAMIDMEPPRSAKEFKPI